MNNLITIISDTQLTLRKTPGNHVSVGVLTTLLGEAYAIGKNDGNRETTDGEVIALIKKFISNINFTLDILLPKITDKAILGQINNLQIEKTWLETFLPRQISNTELAKIIETIISESEVPLKMGDIMKELKAKYDGLYDGKNASVIIKELLAGI
jgi:uncharacterized protein YqeY